MGGGGLEGIGGDLLDSDSRVSPPALQIVLNALYGAALPSGYDHQAAPPAGLTLSLAAYQSLTCCVGEGEMPRELRGAEAILAGYVDEGLSELPVLLLADRKTPLGAETALGRALLKVLVTSHSTKAALAQAEMLSLLDEAGEIDANDETDLRRLQSTRLGLEQVRLLRSFERGGQGYYELAHDHLALAVAASLSEQELQVKVARELLHRALDNWHTAQLLIPLEALKLIYEQRQVLQRLNAEELELLLRSSLALGYETPYWFERGSAGGVKVDELVMAGLKAENFRARVAAVIAVGQIGNLSYIPALYNRLSDLYPQVRAAAIHVLEKIQPMGEWRTHLKYECYVPAGEFIMGEGKKAHNIHLDAFYIAKYPVSNAEYQRYKQDINQPFDIPNKAKSHPVTSVSWYDARDYATWANMQLISEAEWEKAASWDPINRKKRVYPWGDANDRKNRLFITDRHYFYTWPVGQFSPNTDSAYGVSDLVENVRQWTRSLPREYPYQPNDGREDLELLGSRVLRGGCSFLFWRDSNCIDRSYTDPANRFSDIGFRVGCLPSKDL